MEETDELIARFDDVTAEDVRQMACRCFDWQQVSLAAVGRVEAPEEYQTLLDRLK